MIADIYSAKLLDVLDNEIRNSLTPSRAALYLVEENAENNVLLKNAALVLDRQICNMIRILDNVHQFTQDKLVINSSVCSFNEIVQNAIEIAQSSINSRNQLFIYSSCKEELWINGSHKHLANAIANILLNAVKVTETGGKIWMTVAVNKNKVIIVIRDTGIGISKEVLSNIQNIGLGIEFALTQKILSMHGGDIEVFSEGIGKGSEFLITLPLLLEKIEEKKKNPAMKMSHKILNVLIVDGHIDTAESIAIVLKLHGHNVYLSHNGLHAIEMAKTHEPDVVLLSIDLPGLDGYQVACDIRKNNPNVVLIAVTSYEQDINHVFNKQLVKPLNPRELPKVLLYE
jgi:CheY-like chemotaxis protein